MTKRILAFSCLCVLVLNMSAFAVADKSPRASLSAQLAAMLPAVDAVVAIDSKRFFADAAPKMFAANPALLGKITSSIDQFKTEAGIDVRQFDNVVAGLNFGNKGAKDIDAKPVIVARGQVPSAKLIEDAKSASKGKFREEKAGAKTIYLFSAKSAVQATKQAPAAADQGAVDKAITKLPSEIAVTDIDANTIVFGEPSLVRQAISAQKGAPSAELMSMLGKKPTAMVVFAGKVPGGMSSFVPLDNDELGKNIDSIRFVYGSMDMAGDSLALNVTARTLQNTQAKSLVETLEGLQIIGKAFLGGSKSPDKQVYARMIENARFSAAGNEVIFDLAVAQADIDIVVASIK
jgi:hypothetical protein